MILKDILENPSLRNKEFPITANKVFMAHAAMSPFPRRTADAITAYIKRVCAEGQWEYLYADVETETRKYAAEMLGAVPEEIALVSSTSMGLSLVASAIDWKPGDNVIIADGDFPSNIYPWLNLQRQGVEVKFIPRDINGCITLDDVARLVDKNTRLVSLSTVNYVTGFRIDCAAIGEFLHQHNILFCLDAIQSLGTFPIDTANVDFLAGGANKWLLGPVGIGILFVKSNNICRLTPDIAGWKCVNNNKHYGEYNLCFLESAKRFEPAYVSIMGIIGLHSALELLMEIKIENIADRLSHFRSLLAPALREKGYAVFGSDNSEHVSGITTFSSQKEDILALHANLDKRGFVMSLRDGLDGGKGIRIAPHFYNTDEEIEQLLANIPGISNRRRIIAMAQK